MTPAKSIHDILNRHSQLAFGAGLEDDLLRRIVYETSSTKQSCLFISKCSKSMSDTDGQDEGNGEDKKPNSNCTITASGTYPGNSEGLLYLVKDPSSEATSSEQPGRHAASVDIGYLPSNHALASALILQRVLIPIVEQRSRASLSMNNKNIANTTLSSNLHQIKKFASRVIELEQIEARVKLPLPNQSMEDLESDLKDNQIGKLEDVAHNWNETISNVLQSRKEDAPTNDEPLHTIEYWRRRATVLSILTEKLNDASVLRVRELLKQTKPIGSKQLEEIYAKLVRQRDEATDNDRFLSTLEQYFHHLSNDPFLIVSETFPSMLESIRVVWTVSRYFNREDRLFPLLKSISLKLAKRVKERLDVRKLLAETCHDS